LCPDGSIRISNDLPVGAAEGIEIWRKRRVFENLLKTLRVLVMPILFK